jgi:hypothetical protein
MMNIVQKITIRFGKFAEAEAARAVNPDNVGGGNFHSR